MTDHPVCSAGDLTEGVLWRAAAGRMPIVLTLSGGLPIAVSARCPHQGADLSDGAICDHVGADDEGYLTTDPDRPILRCPWHGFEYDLRTGNALVASPEHRRLRLRRLDARIENGWVVVST